jgi:hypothetical protein
VPFPHLALRSSPSERESPPPSRELQFALLNLPKKEGSSSKAIHEGGPSAPPPFPAPSPACEVGKVQISQLLRAHELWRAADQSVSALSGRNQSPGQPSSFHEEPRSRGAGRLCSPGLCSPPLPSARPAELTTGLKGRGGVRTESPACVLKTSQDAHVNNGSQSCTCQGHLGCWMVSATHQASWRADRMAPPRPGHLSHGSGWGSVVPHPGLVWGYWATRRQQPLSSSSALPG